MDLWTEHLVLIHLHHHCHHPSLLQQHPEFRVSVLSFLDVVLFRLWAGFCPIFSQAKSCFSALPFFSKYVMRVALLFGPLAPCWLPWPLTPCWLPRPLTHLSGSHDSPVPLSFETLGLRWASALPDQPPPPDHLKNHLIWVDSIKVIPLACCRISFERLVGTHNPDYSHDSIIAIMELDWLCTGVFKVRHSCLMRAFMNYSACWRSIQALVCTADFTPLIPRQIGLQLSVP
jgi:hypothetical protein